MPPISLQICFQLQFFSRLMSRIFSVRSARFICLLPAVAAAMILAFEMAGLVPAISLIRARRCRPKRDRRDKPGDDDELTLLTEIPPSLRAEGKAIPPP